MSPDTRRAFLAAEWRYLLMLQYPIEAALLLPLVPRGTELDCWRGETVVSLVGFRFLRTRVLGVAIPGHTDFDEVNLRFYVRRRAPEGWRRGVVFVRELVPRRAIALLARLCYNEPYRAVPMRHRVDLERFGNGPGLVRYEWRYGGRWHLLEAVAAGAAAAVSPGSEEEFITEHYWGYTVQRDGGALEYAVAHPRWRVVPVSRARFAGDATALYGPAMARALAGAPVSAFLAEGSPVVVHRGRRLNRAA